MNVGKDQVVGERGRRSVQSELYNALRGVISWPLLYEVYVKDQDYIEKLQAES